jgi:hypothetical protein
VHRVQPGDNSALYGLSAAGLPETELCIACSQQVGSEFLPIVTRTRTSKPGSMKKNYGDVNVEWQRKKLPPGEG